MVGCVYYGKAKHPCQIIQGLKEVHWCPNNGPAGRREWVEECLQDERKSKFKKDYCK